MQILEMKGTPETPGVRLDGKNGILEISGRALTDDAAKFFEPVVEWMKEYTQTPQPFATLSFKLEYISNNSSKAILDLLTIFSRLHGARVVWYFKEDDEDMEETGEEFAELVTVPFEFKTY